MHRPRAATTAQADTATLRGRKKRAKTDQATRGYCENCWIRAGCRVVGATGSGVGDPHPGRLYCALMDERRAWQQRIHAQLYHQGVSPVRGLLTEVGRASLAAADLSAAGRQMVDTALAAVDSLTELVTPLRKQPIGFARRQLGCQALQRLYGVGWLRAAIIWAELGDCRRFANSDAAVRYTGVGSRRTCRSPCRWPGLDDLFSTSCQPVLLIGLSFSS
jgi:transposase